MGGQNCNTYRKYFLSPKNRLLYIPILFLFSFADIWCAIRWNHITVASLSKSIRTCGWLSVVVDFKPDMISSVMSRPSWLGSRILICQKTCRLRLHKSCSQLENTSSISQFSHCRSKAATYGDTRCSFRDKKNLHGVFVFCHHASLLLRHTTSLRSLCRRPSDCAVGFWGGCWGTRIMTIAGRTNGKCGRWAWQCDPAVGNKENKWMTMAQHSYMRRRFTPACSQDLLFLLKREWPTVII